MWHAVKVLGETCNSKKSLFLKFMETVFLIKVYFLWLLLFFVLANNKYSKSNVSKYAPFFYKPNKSRGVICFEVHYLVSKSLQKSHLLLLGWNLLDNLWRIDVGVGPDRGNDPSDRLLGRTLWCTDLIGEVTGPRQHHRLYSPYDHWTRKSSRVMMQCKGWVLVDDRVSYVVSA